MGSFCCETAPAGLPGERGRPEREFPSGNDVGGSRFNGRMGSFVVSRAVGSASNGETPLTAGPRANDPPLELVPNCDNCGESSGETINGLIGSLPLIGCKALLPF